MTKNSDYIVVGLLGKTRGVDGDLWVTPLTDFPDRFMDMKTIFVESRDKWEERKILSSEIIAKRPVLKLVGINNREEATRLTNRRLAVLREQLVGLPDDSYYVFDLIGLKVLDADTMEQIGKVIDVHSYPANDSYSIKLNDGLEKQLPAIEQYVISVDLEKQEMLIDPAGLI